MGWNFLPSDLFPKAWSCLNPRSLERWQMWQQGHSTQVGVCSATHRAQILTHHPTKQGQPCTFTAAIKPSCSFLIHILLTQALSLHCMLRHRLWQFSSAVKKKIAFVLFWTFYLQISSNDSSCRGRDGWRRLTSPCATSDLDFYYIWPELSFPYWTVLLILVVLSMSPVPFPLYPKQGSSGLYKVQIKSQNGLGWQEL